LPFRIEVNYGNENENFRVENNEKNEKIEIKNVKNNFSPEKNIPKNIQKNANFEIKNFDKNIMFDEYNDENNIDAYEKWKNYNISNISSRGSPITTVSPVFPSPSPRNSRNSPTTTPLFSSQRVNSRMNSPSNFPIKSPSNSPDQIGPVPGSGSDRAGRGRVGSNPEIPVMGSRTRGTTTFLI
jgi:hypothetical protein